INEMDTYFNEIFNHKYSKDVLTLTKSIFRKTAPKWEKDVKAKAQIARDMYQEQLDTVIDLESVSKPLQKATFIHNPLTRFNKEPWVYYQLIKLFEKTDETFVQSPYTIPNYKMMKHIDIKTLKEKKVTLLTNSLASTPNLPAYSGYLNYRKQIVDAGVDVLELQTYDSHHSKAFVYDDNVVAIGSFNFDPRSAFLSTESMVVIHSKEVVEGFGLNIETYMDDSLRVQKDYKYNRESDVKPSTLKKVLYKVTSYIIKIFENLL
ncbi:MAG TPA: phospholipase D-like domain-containing protein, partial [Erysipelothrix sp.]|nr:phospholipase D-like domain-containing protein [Erysipelothrix sp.]